MIVLQNDSMICQDCFEEMGETGRAHLEPFTTIQDGICEQCGVVEDSRAWSVAFAGIGGGLDNRIQEALPDAMMMLSLDTLERIARRILELQEIVRQNALVG